MFGPLWEKELNKSVREFFAGNAVDMFCSQVYFLSDLGRLPVQIANDPALARAVERAPLKINAALCQFLPSELKGRFRRVLEWEPPPMHAACASLKADPDFVLTFMLRSYDHLLIADKALSNDPSFIRRCIDAGATQHGTLNFFKLLGPAVQADRALMLHYMRHRGDQLCDLPETLQRDPEFLLAALESHYDWFPVLSEEVRADRRFVKAALRPVSKWVWSTGHWYRTAIEEDYEFHVPAYGLLVPAYGFPFRNKGFLDFVDILACVSPTLKQDPSFVRELLDQGAFCIIEPLLKAGGYALEPDLILKFLSDAISFLAEFGGHTSSCALVVPWCWPRTRTLADIHAQQRRDQEVLKGIPVNGHLPPFDDSRFLGVRPASFCRFVRFLGVRQIPRVVLWQGQIPRGDVDGQTLSYEWQASHARHEIQRFLRVLMEDGRFNQNRYFLRLALPLLLGSPSSLLPPESRSSSESHARRFRNLLRCSKDRDLVLALFQERWWAFEEDQTFRYLSEELRDDVEIATCAVLANPDMFSFASERVRGDRGVAEIAVQSKPVLYKLARGAARHDRGIVLAALQSASRILGNEEDPRQRRLISGVFVCGAEFQPPRPKDSRPFCLTSEPRLIHLPAEYRDDREVVLLAVKQNGLNLQHASDRLRGDWGVVEAASGERKYSRGKALVFACGSLKLQAVRMAQLYAKATVERAVARAEKLRVRIGKRVELRGGRDWGRWCGFPFAPFDPDTPIRNVRASRPPQKGIWELTTWTENRSLCGLELRAELEDHHKTKNRVRGPRTTVRIRDGGDRSCHAVVRSLLRQDPLVVSDSESDEELAPRTESADEVDPWSSRTESAGQKLASEPGAQQQLTARRIDRHLTRLQKDARIFSTLKPWSSSSEHTDAAENLGAFQPKRYTYQQILAPSNKFLARGSSDQTGRHFLRSENVSVARSVGTPSADFGIT